LTAASVAANIKLSGNNNPVEKLMIKLFALGLSFCVSFFGLTSNACGLAPLREPQVLLDERKKTCNLYAPGHPYIDLTCGHKLAASFYAANQPVLNLKKQSKHSSFDGPYKNGHTVISFFDSVCQGTNALNSPCRYSVFWLSESQEFLMSYIAICSSGISIAGTFVFKKQKTKWKLISTADGTSVLSEANRSF
jgi:hypothetical protein